MLSVTVEHDYGFFSNCSVRLYYIISVYNYRKRIPDIVYSNKQFSWYKTEEEKENNTDITFNYFLKNECVNLDINYETLNEVKFHYNDQFINYNNINFKKIKNFIDKYFSISPNIEKIISDMEIKYNEYLNNYEDIAVLFYRGNDKATETNLCTYSDYVFYADVLLKKNPNIKFLLQSDETEFLEFMSEKYPNSFYFNDEIRHMNKCNSTVDKVFDDTSLYSKYYLAITIIMSKCKYIVCMSGNCSIWILLYRGNNDGVIQFLDTYWIVPSNLLKD